MFGLFPSGFSMESRPEVPLNVRLHLDKEKGVLITNELSVRPLSNVLKYQSSSILIEDSSMNEASGKQFRAI